MNIRDRLRLDIEKEISGDGDKDRFEVTRTENSRFGDFATNIALKRNGNPKEIPEEIAGELKDLDYLEKVEVAGPGFINFWVKPSVWQEQIKEVLDQKSLYGSNSIGKGKKARVEFVSANPTGPLHFGNARGGPIGDALASVLELSGYEVLREYYHNDIGGQVEKLGQTIVNVKNGANLEDQEYKGEYIKGLVKQIGDFSNPQEAGKKALEIILKTILSDCKALGISFDKVYSESEFIKSGKTESSLKKVAKFLKKREGATWFVPNDQFLKDRETVVIKSDGFYTYFADDIAYHDLKFGEKYDLVVDILGANHHGHVPRLQAAIKALGYDVSKFHVVLYQWVRFKKGKEILKMSKRSGTFITASEVLDEVGVDAARFFILMHDASSHIDFDLDLASRKSKENPVYYVQYAYARISSILAKVGKKLKLENVDYRLLTTEYELNLIRETTKFPELIEVVAKGFAVHRLATYAIELADSFHKFYENCPVISDDENLQNARLGLINAAKIAFGNTLSLLGISAPEKM